MIPVSGHPQRSDRVTLRSRPAAGGLRHALGELFPGVPEAPPRPRGARVLSAVVQVAAVGIAAITLLLRVPGRPAWRTIFGDDYFKFLAGAIQHPWHWPAYGGYVQVLPRFIAQVVSYLPLTDASLAFALAGVVIAACGALVIFHASAGHIESVKLRVLLAVALVLLPIGPMELIGSGVETPWYLLPVLFWAVLWRPRTRPAMAVAAAVGFLTMASNILAALLAPLLLARLYVLRRPREHAVSAGWLAGCLVQAAYIMADALHGHSRFDLFSLTPGGTSLAYYGHAALLPSLGWHTSWWLRSFAGANGATAIAAVVLAVSFGLILVTQPGARVFVVTALAVGFIFTVVAISINRTPAINPMLPDRVLGTRYTIMADFLIVSALIVGADHALRSRAHDRRRQGAGRKSVMAVTALVVFLVATWAVDFRYTGLRTTTAWSWAPIAARWERDCAHSRTGEIHETVYRRPWTFPCRDITRGQLVVFPVTMITPEKPLLTVRPGTPRARERRGT
jgi:hypothetical protein